MNVTFRQLSIFEAVARLQSFTRASEELHLTQPAVSMQIKQLEQSVGLPLFEQLGKRIYLTEAGQELYRYSRSITDELNELDQVFEEMRGLQRGRLSVSVASTANYFVPRLLATFCQRHQGVTVSIDVTNRKRLLQHLMDNQTDLVVMGQPPVDIDVVAEPFLQNPLVVIAPPGHPLATARHIPLARLQGETFLIREQGSGTRSAMERFFAKYGVTLSTPLELSSNEAIKQGVQAGLGLGLLSLHTLELELALDRVVVLDVEHFPILRHWYIVHREGKRLPAVAEAFRKFVLEEARELLTGLPQVAAAATPAASAPPG
ncbi:MAG: LysR family transcriptional regulator [Gammaproteobacteria bacterium]|jgi:LysR family transcriptional regulator, low CO2-responsive transcriptional regulator